MRDREREREREAETQAKGEADSTQEARCGTRSQDPRITPEPKVDAQPWSHPGIPNQKGLCWEDRGHSEPEIEFVMIFFFLIHGRF